MNDLVFYRKFLQIMAKGDSLNWHERNSGNLTYRLTEEEIKEAQQFFKTTDQVFDLGLELKGLAGDYFLVTAAGQFFMNTYFATDEIVGIIRVLEDGKTYEILYGFENGSRPTSELPAHLMILERKKSQGEDNRVVHHCHPTNVNALTFVYPYDSHAFSARIWKMATEAAVVIPNGVGLLEWMMPGSLEIAQKSAELLDEFNAVVWVHHGMFTTADTLDNTFGMVHVIEKSSEVAWKLECMNREEINHIDKKHIVDLASTFGIELNPKVVEKL